LPKTVAIIGAGPLGRWLALSAARAGFRVLLEDVMPANLHHAQEALRATLGAELCAQGRKADPSNALRSAQDDRLIDVTFVSTIEDAVREADLAIDCVPDELESKLEIFCLLDRMAPPRTVLVTPTTRLSIADLAACTYRADKCVAIAAEASALAGNAGGEILLRTTSRTATETVAVVEEFWRRLGFAPVFEGDVAEQTGKATDAAVV
jgi:3-hydroxybutyryl-CoA dehydrogenase